MINLNTIDEFKQFIGNGIATVEFFKKDGSLRKMNFRLGVGKYVKGTAPEATAKRAETNASKLQMGVYEMKGTSTGIEAENYRTLTIDPKRLVSVSANGFKLVNEDLIESAELGVLNSFDLGEDAKLAENVEIVK